MDKEVKKQSCYHSLDFASVKKRMQNEDFKVDPYKVELEDYENINDLIARSVRTKTKFVPEHDANAIYDSDDDIAAQITPEWFVDQMQQTSDEPVVTEDKGKQSDAKSEGETGSDAPVALQ